MHRAIGKPGWRTIGQLVGMCLLLLWSAAAVAAGLGDIKVESGLNQPLFARIEVLMAAGEAPGNWVVALGGVDRYDRMGLRYPPDADQLRVTLLQLANGKAQILVEGRQPLKELIFDIVLTLDDGRSVQVRHYPVLVDFPRLEEPVQAAVERPGLARPRPVEPRSELEQPQYTRGEAIYGPVRPGDNLWLIASNVRGDSSLDLSELMEAIFQLNPDAFMGNDMDRLKIGIPLVLPDLGADYQSRSTPNLPSSRSPEQLVRPGLQRAEEDLAIEVAPETDSLSKPEARLELQGRPDAATVADSLDRWLETDNAATAANISEIRRDLSFAAAEIETYRNENDILKTRIEDLELRASNLQTLLSLQTESIATGREIGEPEPEEVLIDAPEEVRPEELSTDPAGPGWTRYAFYALVLLVIFVLYVVVRNVREDRARREKTADLVNRLKSARSSNLFSDD